MKTRHFERSRCAEYAQEIFVVEQGCGFKKNWSRLWRGVNIFAIAKVELKKETNAIEAKKVDTRSFMEKEYNRYEEKLMKNDDKEERKVEELNKIVEKKEEDAKKVVEK